MSIKITNTGKASKHKKILVYGTSGSGKTRMCKTAEKPLIISSENKFESLTGIVIPVWQVSTIDDFDNAIDNVLGKHGKKFSTICIDSISDIAETAVHHEKKNHAHPMKAHGVIQDRIIEILKKIRDSDKRNFYIIAKAEMFQNDENMDQYQPNMPGKKLSPQLPYIFDYVFAMRRQDDDEEDGYSYLQTNITHDMKWVTKDSSGKLNPVEEPNLKKIFKKLG